MLKPALMPALDKEVDQSCWIMLDVLAVRTLCCHAIIMALAVTTVDIMKTQEFNAQVCLYSGSVLGWMKDY